MNIFTEANAHQFANSWINECSSMSRAAFHIRLAMESQQSIASSFLVSNFPESAERAKKNAAILGTYLQTLLVKLGSNEIVR